MNPDEMTRDEMARAILEHRIRLDWQPHADVIIDDILREHSGDLHTACLYLGAVASMAADERSLLMAALTAARLGNVGHA